MKVLLIIPPNIGRYVVATVPHAGIAYVVSFLERENHDTEIVDMRIHPKNNYLFRKVENFKPDLIGITSASIGYKMAYDIINTLKEKYPQIPLAIGGSYASTVYSKVLEDTKADYAVYGEGEQTFVDLANNMPLEKIKGLIWRRGKEIIMNPPQILEHNLDKYPFPKYEKFELNKLLEKRIPIVSSRGCPNRCTFCSIQLVMGYPFRARSPENIVEEIEYWYKRGYKNFEFSDDNFTFNMPRAERICDLIAEKGLKIEMVLGNGIRADRVNDVLMKKMRNAGVIWTAYGLESSDPDVLKNIKKDLRLDKLTEALELSKKYGMKTQVNFIIGCPGQTWEKFQKDLKFAEEINPDQLRFFNLIPYPGTEVFEWVQKHGRFLHSPEDYLNSLDYWGEEPVFETDDFTREERIKAFRLGQEKVMELFLKRHFGDKIGIMGFKIWKNKFVQKYGMKPATWFWIILKKLRIKQD
jgi:anaerobic magnesium-protoporphyrin IX monomethyl ester cyclase